MKLFSSEKYTARRKQLAEKLGSGLIWIMGNADSPANYKDNIYPFRQNSNFLYYFGLNAPDLNGVVDAATGEAWIYGHELTIDDIIWTGEIDKLSNLATKVGVESTREPGKLWEDLAAALQKGQQVHYLPPYRHEHFMHISKLSLASPSNDLIKAVIQQRAVKDAEEIGQMTAAVNITRAMHITAMQKTKPGMYEYEVVAEFTKVCRQHHADFSYGPIFSINGQVLHNHHHDNLMKEGQLALNDSGAHTDMLYAGDITRTYPVSGKFTQQQKEIYQIVLEMEKSGIDMTGPDIYYRDIHLAVNKIMLQRFKELGLVSGNVEDMLEQGVYGLFMPHGLGHMIGLDVHDMEDLGENLVGYEEGQERSQLLGLRSLRLARRLKPGFVLTVEPGIYFIPQLIQRYKAEGKYTDFVNYNALQNYFDFGGIRIEDNVVITNEGHTVLGDYIPKEVDEIESVMAG